MNEQINLLKSKVREIGAVMSTGGLPHEYVITRGEMQLCRARVVDAETVIVSADKAITVRNGVYPSLMEALNHALVLSVLQRVAEATGFALVADRIERLNRWEFRSGEARVCVTAVHTYSQAELVFMSSKRSIKVLTVENLTSHARRCMRDVQVDIEQTKASRAYHKECLAARLAFVQAVRDAGVQSNADRRINCHDVSKLSGEMVYTLTYKRADGTCSAEFTVKSAEAAVARIAAMDSAF